MDTLSLEQRCRELEKELEQKDKLIGSHSASLRKLSKELEIARKVRRDFEVELINTKEELERYREWTHEFIRILDGTDSGILHHPTIIKTMDEIKEFEASI